jgi:hypothetical protein
MYRWPQPIENRRYTHDEPCQNSALLGEQHVFLLGGVPGRMLPHMHPDHIHQPIRPEAVNRSYYEGPLMGAPDTWPALFLKSLREIPAS